MCSLTKTGIKILSNMYKNILNKDFNMGRAITFAVIGTGMFFTAPANAVSSQNIHDFVVGVNGDSYSIDSDLTITQPTHIGGTGLPVLELFLNNGASLIGYGVANEYDGITVTEDHEFYLTGSQNATMSGFDTAFTVNSAAILDIHDMTFVGNNTDILNEGVMGLTGNNEINSGIDGSGLTVIIDGKTVANEINQMLVGINKDGTLEMNADGLNASIFKNDGIFNVLGGTLDENISAVESYRGAIYFEGDTTTTGNITQNYIRVEDNVELINTGTITGQFSLGNDSDIFGVGKMIITQDSSNWGRITKQEIEIADGVTLTNVGSITTSLDVPFELGATQKIEGGGTISFSTDAINNGLITQHIIYLTGTLTNNGTITVDRSVVEIDEEIDGTGALYLSGNRDGIVSETVSNFGIIKQDFINISNTSELENMGTLDIKLGIWNNGLFINQNGYNENFVFGSGETIISGVNTGYIEQDTITVDSALANNDYGYLDGKLINTAEITGDGVLALRAGSDIGADITQYRTSILGDTNIQAGSTITSRIRNKATISGDGNIIAIGYSENEGIIISNTNVGNGVNSATFENFENGIMANVNVANRGEFINFGTANFVSVDVAGEFTNYGDAPNIANNGILNYVSNDLNSVVTGSGIMNIDHDVNFVSGASVDQSELNINESGVFNIGTNQVGLGATDINISGALNIEISDIAENSSSFSGGGLTTTGNIFLDYDSTLNLTIAPNKLTKGTSTGDIQLLNAATYVGDFDYMFSNNRYDIEYGYAYGSYAISYTTDANEVVANAGGTDNAEKVATAWDNVSGLTGVADATRLDLYSLSQRDMNGYVKALDAVAPKNSQHNVHTFRLYNNAIDNQITARQGLAKAENSESLFENETAWATIFANNITQDDSDVSNGFSGSTFGFATGVDADITNNIQIGLGYGYNNGTMDSDVSETGIDSHNLFLYGKYDFGSDIYFRGLMNFGFANVSEDSNAYGIVNSLEYSSQNFGLQAYVGQSMDYGFTPEFGFNYISVAQDDYTDSYGQLVSTDNADLLSVVVGTSWSKDFMIMTDNVIKPTARLGMSYDVISSDTSSVVNIGDASYKLSNEAINPFALEFGLGLSTDINGWELGIGYDWETRSDFTSHTGSFNVKYQF